MGSAMASVGVRSVLKEQDIVGLGTVSGAGGVSMMAGANKKTVVITGASSGKSFDELGYRDDQA